MGRLHIIFMCAAVALGCGKKDNDDKKKGGPPPATDPKVTTPTPPPEPPKPADKPPAPKDSYVGQNRVINLYVDASGKGQTVDVWLRRSFTHGPALLVEKLELGQASEWFGAPKEQSVVVMPTGAGSDGKELAGVMKAKDGEKWTTVLEFDGTGMTGGATQDAPAAADAKTTFPPKPPAAGKGLVELRAGALQKHEQALTEKYGGRSFMVGDGKGACIRQRVEDAGYTASVLGGTQPVLLELDPGKHTITFHKWPGKCDTPAVYQVDVDVEAGKGTLVHLYTPDAKALAHLAIPMGL